MLELVSTDDARAHLRLDDTEDDSWLSIFIPAISSAVAMWLKEEWRLYVPEVDPEGHIITDSNGDPIPSSDSNGYVVQPIVRAAVLVELLSCYTFRDGDTKNDMTAGVRFNDGRGYGYILNKTSTALLSALRKPTLG